MERVVDGIGDGQINSPGGLLGLNASATIEVGALPVTIVVGVLNVSSPLPQEDAYGVGVHVYDCQIRETVIVEIADCD